MSEPNIRAMILTVITQQQRQFLSNLQSNSVLQEVHEQLRAAQPRGLSREQLAEREQAPLTAFHDLFRTGYLAWGFNLSNPDPPFFHVTEQGRRALRDISRDPANPEGYFAHLRAAAQLNAVAESYIQEGVACYAADLPRAAAVMVGAAVESLVLELRDLIVSRMTELGRTVPKAMRDWRAKPIVDAIYDFAEYNKAAMPRHLWEAAEGYWSSYLQQIRAARNDAGHPSSIDSVTIDTVHASLLILPELAKLASQLRDWVSTSYQ